MDIKGKIESTAVKNNLFMIHLATKDGKITIISQKEIEGLLAYRWVNFTNIEKHKGLFKSQYELTNKSFAILHPGLCIGTIEMNLANKCGYAPLILQFVSSLSKDDSREKDFYNTMHNYIQGDEHSKVLSERLPKDIKAKFSFKPVEVSVKYGFLVKDSLYLGKLPIVFSNHEMKGKVQSVISGSDKYILIESDGTLKEEKIEINEKQSLMSSRNSLVLEFFKENHKDLLSIECSNDCPAHNYCKIIKERNNEFDLFDTYFKNFLRQNYKVRADYQKTLRYGINPKRLSVQVRSGVQSAFDFNAKIADNEGKMHQLEDVVVIEKPPLDRKTLGVVKHLSFEEIGIKLDAPIVNGEAVTPISIPKQSFRGIFQFVYSDTPPTKILKGNSAILAPIQQNSYVDGDAEQNASVNLILSDNPLVFVKGENGTGKKFVAHRAAAEMLERGQSVLVVTDSRIAEFNKVFEDLVSNERLKIFNIADSELFESKITFDQTFFFLLFCNPSQQIIAFKDYDIALINIAGLSNKLSIFSPKDIKTDFESHVPAECSKTLLTEHRFGTHLFHFIKPMLDDGLKTSDDVELKVINKENIDAEFMPIINPEKLVQFVTISPKIFGKKNKWNINEAQFTVDAISQFIKAGVERASIGVIVPFERQKALIEKMLDDKKIPDVDVMELSDAKEKDVVFINFVENSEIKSELRETQRLKFAFTRAKSKLILVGNTELLRKNKFLFKLIPK